MSYHFTVLSIGKTNQEAVVSLCADDSGLLAAYGRGSFVPAMHGTGSR